MAVFLDFLFFVVILFSIIYFLARLWEFLETVATNQDRTDFIWTDDGRRIAVHRYNNGNKSVGQPVILCHGLAGNRFIFDLKNGPSLAEFLKASGRDVWVAELRGAGYSGRAALLLTDSSLNWNFDDHLNYDLNAIISHVTEVTGSEAPHWVGHSMGGMLIEAHLAKNSGPRLASAIAIGSPADFGAMGDHPFRTAMAAKWGLRVFPFNPLIPLTKVLLPFNRLFPNFTEAFFCSENIEASVLKKIVAIGTEMMSSSALWLNMASFMENGKFSDSTGRPYLEGLKSSETPLLAICGSNDRMAPEQSVLSVCRQPGSVGVRESAVMGKKSGCKSDYGHVDLLLGVRAHEEVFPVIEDWLKRWDAPSEGTAA